MDESLTQANASTKKATSTHVNVRRMMVVKRSLTAGAAIYAELDRIVLSSWRSILYILCSMQASYAPLQWFKGTANCLVLPKPHSCIPLKLVLTTQSEQILLSKTQNGGRRAAGSGFRNKQQTLREEPAEIR